MNHKKIKTAIWIVVSAIVSSTVNASDYMDDMTKRLSDLESANKKLRLQVEHLEFAAKNSINQPHTPLPTDDQQNNSALRINHSFSYDMLDPTTLITRKGEYILEHKKTGFILNDTVYLGGAITSMADYQVSNTDSKFGYLMRHPTSINQKTKIVSEAVIHSAQFDLVANINYWITSYMEFLYDPEQSFGAGTNTALARNQMQLRQGYLLFGDLEKSPLYASVGKMSIPFGLTDTVNPFTASTVWHAFGGLAYGAKVGYLQGGFNVRGMAIQSGPQFRGANVPVESGSAATSSLNNYAVDLSYSIETSKSSRLLIGSSATKGSAYCQEFPASHFGACKAANGAYDFYAQWKSSDWTLQAEYAKTEHVWNASFNPALPQYPASAVASWEVGVKYRTHTSLFPVHYSAEFSRFVAGPSNAPWNSQDQWVLGIATFPTISNKFFLELIGTRGYVPLAFMSGGNAGSLGVGAEGTWSDQNAFSSIVMIGANVAF